MNIYLINLDNRTDRLYKCDARLKRLSVAYNRISAVYGKTLSSEEKKKYVRHFLWWCHAGRRVMDGEIGCALSHIEIYKKMINEGVRIGCILEDDVVIDDAFPEQIKRIESWINPQKAQVILLSNHTGVKGRDGEFVRIKKGSFAEGYVLTSLAAEAILRINFPLRVAADTWDFFQRRGQIELYSALPAVCSQDWSEGFVSEVYSYKGYNFTGVRLLDFLIFKFLRVVGKTIDYIV